MGQTVTTYLNHIAPSGPLSFPVFLEDGWRMGDSVLGSGDVVFEDGFETGDLEHAEYGFYWDGDTSIWIVNEDGAGNNYVVFNGDGVQDPPLGPEDYIGKNWVDRNNGSGNCMAVRYRAGGGINPNYLAEQRWALGPSTNEIWIGYWIRVPQDYTHPTYGDKQENAKFFHIWQDLYEFGINPPPHSSGPSVCVQTRPATGAPYGSSRLVIYTIKHNANWPDFEDDRGTSDHECSEGTDGEGSDEFHLINDINQREEWMHMVFHVKASTSVDTPNGVLEIWRKWYGGSYELVHTENALDIYSPGGDADGWHHGYLMGWSNSYYTAETFWLIDDFQAALTNIFDFTGPQIVPVSLTDGWMIGDHVAVVGDVAYEDGFETGDLSGFIWGGATGVAVGDVGDGFEVKTGDYSARFKYPSDAAPDLRRTADSGTADNESTSTTLVDSTKDWPEASPILHYIYTTGGLGSGQRRYITYINGTSATISPAWDTTPNDTTTYDIRWEGDDMAELRFNMYLNITELWLEYDLFIPTNYNHRNAVSGDNNKFLIIWDDTSYSGTTSFLMEIRKGTTTDRSTINMRVKDGLHSFKDSWAVDAVDFIHEGDYGNWVQVRIHLKIGLDGGSESEGDGRGGTGEYHLWKDEVLKASATDLSWDPNDTPTSVPYLRQGYFMGYSNSGYYDPTYFYMDNVKFYNIDPGW